MIATVVILVIMVQVIQTLCNLLVRVCDKRMRS